VIVLHLAGGWCPVLPASRPPDGDKRTALLRGEVGGPASRSRVTTSDVVVVVVFALFVRSLSLWMGFGLFLVRSLFCVDPWGSVSRARSVGIDWGSGWLLFDPIYTSLHTSLIDRHLLSFRELVCEESSLDRRLPGEGQERPANRRRWSPALDANLDLVSPPPHTTTFVYLRDFKPPKNTQKFELETSTNATL
jgi:hypothetical protein